ncbi:hypothetical protein RHMOL_Rhmol11G0275000 [Rhododendron molle]|uniref:Uncharacterized protein n=1 Tax=Rhododendron molle TaxID=49168 RepID=A0ACC0LX07_RHOML|nr:hypothetical protein RHMOL_Rhmol11G0275000 [Rhododendron molle]
MEGWSRRTFGNNKERIQSLRNSLGWVQQQPYSELICKKEKALKEDLEMDFLGRAAMIGWNIWKAMNDFIFKGKSVNPLETLATIRYSSLENSSFSEIAQVHMDNPTTRKVQTTGGLRTLVLSRLIVMRLCQGTREKVE